MSWWRRWMWLGWIGVVGSGLLIANIALPRISWSRQIVFDGCGSLSVLMIVVGVLLNRPRDKAMWLLFALGNGSFVIGDICYAYQLLITGSATFPSWSDAFYLLGYLPILAGLWLLIRHGATRRDRAGLLDALIVASGFGLISWSIVMRPIVQADPPPLERTVLLGYPFIVVVMLGMLAWVATTAGSRTASYRLLFAALALVTGGNILYSITAALTSFVTGPITESCYLLSYILWAAATLHPSVRQMAERVGERDTSFSRARVVTIIGFVLIPAVVLVVQGVRDPADIDFLPIAITTGILCLLMLTRAGGLVTRIREQSASMTHLALHDGLTGLPNRRLFEQGIGAAVRSGQPVQVALVDLNDFKLVNDRLGHIVGDRLLVEFGRRLRSVLRADDIVARLGGDEFALLMHDASAVDADRIIARVLTQLDEPVVLDGHQLMIRASIGLADSSGTTEPLEVVRRADIAMYAAKKGGTGPQRYRAELDEQAVAQARLTTELRDALDNGEFHLVYQPIVGLPDGRLAGVEALLRWTHPELGPVGPDEFIPVAEKTGLIVPLGRWVLEQALLQLCDWDRRFGEGAPARVSVNVSARQLGVASVGDGKLGASGFAEWVAVVLTRTGLHADRLTVEVTETAVLTGGRAVAELEALHDLGVRVALDDFGTGHSSLGLLQAVPVDVLKVDRRFVDLHDSAQAVIASALISISDGLNLTAIAEGVETADQAGLLFQLGYRFAQGYHFGRPMPAAAFAEWIEAGSALEYSVPAPTW